MDGRGLQRDDHLIAPYNERRLGNERHDLGRLAEAGQLEGGHRVISSDGPPVQQLIMRPYGLAPRGWGSLSVSDSSSSATQNRSARPGEARGACPAAAAVRRGRERPG